MTFFICAFRYQPRHSTGNTNENRTTNYSHNTANRSFDYYQNEPIRTIGSADPIGPVELIESDTDFDTEFETTPLNNLHRSSLSEDKRMCLPSPDASENENEYFRRATSPPPNNRYSEKDSPRVAREFNAAGESRCGSEDADKANDALPEMSSVNFQNVNII